MRRTGISPVTFGFKYNLIKESDVLPQTTWLSHISNSWVSAGDYASVYPEQIFHEQRLMLEKELTPRLGIASNIGISGGMNGTNGFVDGGMFSLALGYDLGNNFGVYAEYFSDWARPRHAVVWHALFGRWVYEVVVERPSTRCIRRI